MTEDQQYATVNGRTVDLDLERVFAYLLDEDYTSDPLLSQVFWVIVRTYFKVHIPVHQSEIAVSKLVNLEMVRGLLLNAGIRYETVDPDNPVVQGNMLASEVKNITLFARIRTEFGWTHYVPGSSLGHALTLSVIQAARELSEMSLNPQGQTH